MTMDRSQHVAAAATIIDIVKNLTMFATATLGLVCVLTMPAERIDALYVFFIERFYKTRYFAMALGAAATGAFGAYQTVCLEPPKVSRRYALELARELWLDILLLHVGFENCINSGFTPFGSFSGCLWCLGAYCIGGTLYRLAILYPPLQPASIRPPKASQ